MFKIRHLLRRPGKSAQRVEELEALVREMGQALLDNAQMIHDAQHNALTLRHKREDIRARYQRNFDLHVKADKLVGGTPR